jgi:hypothetical protein
LFKNIDESFFKVSKINILLTVIENIGFAVFGYWNYTVLLGSLLGLFITTVFFYSICVSVPKALRYGDADLAQKSIKASRSLRTIVMAVGLFIAIKLPWFDMYADTYEFIEFSNVIYHINNTIFF